jgi:hypothetical protein
VALAERTLFDCTIFSWRALKQKPQTPISALPILPQNKCSSITIFL